VQQYENVSGDSGVERYGIGSDFIRVQFRGGGTYLYDYAATGAEHVERMKALAVTGRGLGTYISQHVRKDYASREGARGALDESHDRMHEPESEPRADEGAGDPDCVFCAIAGGAAAASVVMSDETTIAFLDLRQFHPGHVLVIPRRHVPDIRAVDDDTASAVMRAVARVARAVDRVFPNDGLSIWHSAGEGANQEVPHLHFHVHPRRFGDDVLRVYPSPPAGPSREVLDGWADDLRAALHPTP
jgi:histidine triad (HIT) family protein